MITVGELIERLQDFPEDTEVRIAWQPNYPMESSIDSSNIELVEVDTRDGDGVPVVYLPEATHIGYLPGEAAEAIGWR